MLQLQLQMYLELDVTVYKKLACMLWGIFRFMCRCPLGLDVYVFEPLLLDRRGLQTCSMTAASEERRTQ